MRYEIAMCALACAFAVEASAQRPYPNEPRHNATNKKVASHTVATANQSGTLVEMTVVNCAGETSEDPAELLVSDNATPERRKSKRECVQYKFQTEKAIYVIRPVDSRHPALLPVGETMQFRIKGDRLALRPGPADGSEREYKVLLVTTRGTEVSEELTVW